MARDYRHQYPRLIKKKKKVSGTISHGIYWTTSFPYFFMQTWFYTSKGTNMWWHKVLIISYEINTTDICCDESFVFKNMPILNGTLLLT